MPIKKDKSLNLTPKQTSKAAIKEIENAEVKTPEEVAASISKELTVLGLKPNEKFQMKDPITGEVKDIVLSRTGTQETDLVVALADPNLSRDKKDYALSMYLFGRGAESASFILDIMRSKGEHTKETRVFKSQMRFDFEALVDSLVDHLETQARNTASILGLDLEKEIRDYRDWLLSLPKGDEHTLYSDYYISQHGEKLKLEQRIECVLISQSIYQLDEAQKLTKARMNIALAREREKGGGIYVDKNGKIYDATMPEVDEIIKADRAATNEIQND